ncbi:hypothetical protein N836_07130 [Leptolyngbya sp. Heron Island J]|uniref:hypothetical protein n=1 Tax=Leptolyngbya sp. Heron Island J TaxID=1385935 RepID=UPI0003B98E50|nr:hypothetical protein [Leptolyngbya sp. Heron Island J]ESA36539.1 hypothetical protein N836_07130 [Leptolyngbya sp. Heron Island J]
MSLAEQIRFLENRIFILERTLKALGLPLSEWVSPNQASNLLGISRGRILSEVKVAEYARATRKRCDLSYGKHYRKVGSDWQINWQLFQSVINTPEDERIIVEQPEALHY